jgi:hypothetical protein
LIGIRDEHDLGYATVLARAVKILKDKLSARYVEFIIRAHELAKIEVALDLYFIPSAYFPAFKPSGGQRYDYVVFSRSFEMLDFRNIELEGVNQQYLLLYFRNWKELSLNRLLLGKA